MSAGGQSRRAAAFAVARWILDKTYPAESLPNGPDRAFIQDLVYTTVRRFRPLRAILGELVKTWPKGELEALLLVGAAQILYMPDVPDFAAVSETVEAAKKCANRSIPKVVNGVLRNLLRRRAEFEAKLKAAPLGERESFPNALIKRWVARYGVENAEKLCKFHNEPAETWICYRDGHFEKVPRGIRVMDMPGFEAGEFVVQDPATALAVEALDAKIGETALDFCAAPGGKTIRLGWQLGADHVIAQEVNPKRRHRLVENLTRCKLDDLRTIASVADELAQGTTFDRVLVDAPCSNTGVLRRRPDARWNWTAEKLEALVSLQGEILENAARFVAPGGRLVYATCSNEPEENGDRIASFLAVHPDFKEVERRESLPFETGHDGAFACALMRT